MTAMGSGETMSTAAVALGSNLPSCWGSPADAVHEGVRRLSQLGHMVSVSNFRETEPVGYTDQPRFVNAAALLQTHLKPLELLRGLLAIEAGMGRVRWADLPSKGPRIIDLDLLLYQSDDGVSVVLEHPELTLPHPLMHLRRFVLEPLLEIAPTLRHSLLGVSIADLLRDLPKQI